jgi:DNA modification methylase
MKVESVQVTQLKQHPENMRAHPERNLAAIMHSLKEFGQTRPIVINEKNEVLCGNGTLAAAKRLGLQTLFVRRLAGLPRDRQLKLMIADNRCTDLSGWNANLEKIMQELGEGQDKSLFEAEMSFTQKELFDIRDSLRIKQDFKTESDAAPPAPQKPVSVAGQIYKLGRHKIACGDSSDKTLVGSLLGDRKIDLMFTDPPYGVSYVEKGNSMNRWGKGGSQVHKRILNDDAPLDEVYKCWCDVFSLWRTYFETHSAYFVCSPSGSNLIWFLKAMEASGIPSRHGLVWLKNTHVFGRTDFNYKHEMLLYGWADAHKFYGGGEQKFSVWEYPKPAASKLHPTMKPVALVTNAILHTTRRGMLVVDPFSGAGSTLIAAEETDRVCYGCELDPVYCDVIRRRWAEHIHGEGCDWKSLTGSESQERQQRVGTATAPKKQLPSRRLTA